jgi:GNAT superfamily N-acetyltransferase
MAEEVEHRHQGGPDALDAGIAPDMVPSTAGRGTGNVVLADGTTVQVRAIRPDDDDALRAFHSRLSPESIVLRFFSAHPRLSDAEVQRFTHVDGVDRVALVAEHGPEIVAVARYDRSPGRDEAEVAFVVDDAFQGHGLGTILLQRLAGTARSHGIRWLVADTLSENFRMLHVFRDAGFPRKFTRAAEVMHVVMDIGPPT